MKVLIKNADQYRDEYIEVGLRIGYLRRQKGMTQEQLADRAGISPGFLGQIEAPNLAVGFSLSTIFAIAEALEVPAYKLLQFD
ncbi:MAG: helix-turn-helix transcriptional regulator [Clostridiales bacterium]|nr:helix-turn-helix transcriptional regulator [Clostridiales bacterium]